VKNVMQEQRTGVAAFRWSMPVAGFQYLGVLAFLWQFITTDFALAEAKSEKPIFPQEQLCPALPEVAGKLLEDAAEPSIASADGPSIVAPEALISWLLGEYLVRDAALDADGDGNTLIEEKVRALTEDNYCSAISKKCSAADEEALAGARKQLRAFADQGGGPGYVVELLDRSGNIVQAAPKTILTRDLLDLERRTAQIRCVALPISRDDSDEPVQTYWHENGDGGFRLAGNIDDLSKSRGSLGGVKAAELSITSDLIEDETAYRVNGVAGYAFDVAGGGDIQTSFIPFIEAERVTSGSETQIDTLGAGFQQAATVNWPSTLRSEFAVTPVYNTDSDFESQTGTLKFRWTPSLDGNRAWFPLGFPQVFGPIELRLGLDLLLDAGRVFDEGDQDNLDGEGNFLRLGNQAAMQVRGAPNNLFRQFELKLANRYLHNVDTAFENINQFDAALAYLFPGNEHYQLSFAYSNGRDENSLELYEFWQTQFGIRF
jgi:hypothetical protein